MAEGPRTGDTVVMDMPIPPGASVMTYPLLINELIRRCGRARVHYPAFPDLGCPSEADAQWMITVRTAAFEVDAFVDGAWRPAATFRTEAAACEFVFQAASRRAPGVGISRMDVLRADREDAELLASFEEEFQAG